MFLRFDPNHMVLMWVGFAVCSEGVGATAGVVHLSGLPVDPLVSFALNIIYVKHFMCFRDQVC